MYSDLFKDVLNNLSKTELKKEIKKKASTGPISQHRTDTDVIKSLYNLKSEPEDIIDAAHPETAVVAPAYDAMNGVVENLKERQNIMAYIATKMPEGGHVARRYVKASSDLIQNLIKAATLADSEDDESLAKHADYCAHRLEKKALGPLAWGIIGMLGTLGGYVGLTQHVGVSEGIINDIDNAITELNEASEDVYPRTKSQIFVIINKLRDLKNKANNYLNIDISQPESVNDLLAVKENPNAMEQLEKANEYKVAINDMAHLIPTYVNILNNAARKESNVGPFLSGLSEAYRLFDPDDVKDASVALEVLTRSLQTESERLSTEMNTGHEKGIKSSIEEAKKNPEMQGPLLDILRQSVDS